MLKIILMIILVISGVYLAYFLILACGIFKKDKNKISNKKKNNFAVLIAARNEELVIGNLVKSLKKQKYPKENYEIFVIVNNCTDNTKKVALEAGASIIECTEKVKSKGEVLKFAFNKLKDNKEIDAYVIFDADNLVHSDFLNSMNDMINSGYSVAQGFRDTKNISDNWLSSSYAMLYYIQSLFINKARYNLGKSSFLNGTGFMVKKEVIDKYGFDPITLTEDIEFTAMCAVNGEKIAFASKAITYDEQVVNFKDSLKQRKRWSLGAMQCLRNYGTTLIKKGIKEKRLECFDIVLFYFSVILQVITTLISFIYLIFMLCNSLNDTTTLITALTLFLITFILGVTFRAIIMKKLGKGIKENIGGILLFDLFLLTWVPINFICLFIKDASWDQIKHDRNIDMEGIS